MMVIADLGATAGPLKEAPISSKFSNCTVSNGRTVKDISDAESFTQHNSATVTFILNRLPGFLLEPSPGRMCMAFLLQYQKCLQQSHKRQSNKMLGSEQNRIGNLT